MSIFKRNNDVQPMQFFEESADTLDSKYDEMMSWIKYLSRKDYNRLKKAMDAGYNAYQTLHGIEPDDDTNVEGAEFMLTKEDR